MLSQEFPLPDVLRIWDSLLSDETRSDFLIDVCTAMILLVRTDILTNDFPENMKLLQVRGVSPRLESSEIFENCKTVTFILISEFSSHGRSHYFVQGSKFVLQQKTVT